MRQSIKNSRMRIGFSRWTNCPAFLMEFHSVCSEVLHNDLISCLFNCKIKNYEETFMCIFTLWEDIDRVAGKKKIHITDNARIIKRESVKTRAKKENESLIRENKRTDTHISSCIQVGLILNWKYLFSSAMTYK